MKCVLLFIFIFIVLHFCQEYEYNFHLKEPHPTSRFCQQAYVVNAYMVNEAYMVDGANFLYMITGANIFAATLFLDIGKMNLTVLSASRKKCIAPIYVDCSDPIARNLEHVQRQSCIHAFNVDIQLLLYSSSKPVESVYLRKYQDVNSNSLSQQNTGNLVFHDKGVEDVSSEIEDIISGVDKATVLSVYKSLYPDISSFDEGPSYLLSAAKLFSSHVSFQTEEKLSSLVLQDKETVKEKLSSTRLILFQDRETIKGKYTVASYVSEASNFSQKPINEEYQHVELEHRSLAPHSRFQQDFSDFTSLKKATKSLSLGVTTQMDAQNSTIYRPLCGHLPSSEIDSLPQFMSFQDAFGNTLLHSVIEAQNYNAVPSILIFAPPECLEVRNEDGLTPLELAFENKLWGLAHDLAEHQIKHGAGHMFLQDYFYKAMREQGGVDFLPYLLDLWKRYFPDFDLNFSADGSGLTPWWYLANSNDVSVMRRALQTLKEHSIDLMQLVTHTKRQTKFVEVAVHMNRELIQEITGWHPGSRAGQDIEDGGNEPLSTAEAPSQNAALFAASSFGKPDSLWEEQQQINSPCMFPTLNSWDAEVQQHFSDFSSLKKFIQSLPPKVLMMKDAKCRTICHALVGSCCHLSSAKVNHLFKLLSCVCLPQCVVCEDASGNTPLHCVNEAQNSNVDVILRSVPDLAKCLEVRNEDGLTPLELAFEKKLWVPAHALAEHQIKHGAGHMFLQDYFYKAMREQGGVDFLPYLLDLWESYFPDFDLNFSADGSGRTPWWYLANSNDVSVMCRALQTLKDHSIDFMPLLTHTKRHTRLVEEAADKNRKLFTMIQKVAGWHHSEGDQDTSDGDYTHSDFTGVLSRATSCSSVSTTSYCDQQLNEKLNQHESGASYKASVTSQDCYHSSPTSDSAIEEQKQVDLKLKLKKQKSKKTGAKVSVDYLSL